MMDRAAWHAALAAHPVHGIPPVGDPYVWGRWHKDRAALSGYGFEARVTLKSLIRRNDPAKFLMFGRPRSGTTLLRRLLNQVDGLQCDGEMLHHAVLSPRGFLNRLAGIKPARAYGCKLLSYQMFEVQKIADPVAFFEGLLADGFSLIHVRRDTFDQALSLSVAQTTRSYHMVNGQRTEAKTVELDPDLFAAQLRHHSAMLAYEDLLMSGLPHEVVQYETDLRDADRHQPCVDRLCAAIGVAPSPVTADTERVSGRREITNLADLRARAAELASPKET